MNTDNRHNIEELLIRYCEGQVSKEEAIYVKRWINDSDENRRIARRINYICFATDEYNISGTKPLNPI